MRLWVSGQDGVDCFGIERNGISMGQRWGLEWQIIWLVIIQQQTLYSSVNWLVGEIKYEYLTSFSLEYKVLQITINPQVLLKALSISSKPCDYLGDRIDKGDKGQGGY